ncbi:UDP-2,3-diacylglucosamine diphosphatase [Campylobacter lanienae]|uniref:UDP-2,3-diacylglucosamine diphosphatase n=1 Tax=Campylobacter lanienae TaxID=75658 RepID=UPI0011AD3674|nr:metallophosphoesterase [Campylobacter lanienae]TWO13796.1 UDP-2,3-diacylglucosamine diphosphatase [Campylobacter lanienae]
MRILDGAIFIADAHENDKRSQFLKLIKSFNSGTLPLPPQIFLVGDIFDFLSSTSYTQIFYKEWIEELNLLAKKSEIHYFEGNHDFNLSSVFKGITIYPISSQPAIFTLDDKRVAIAHGDIFLGFFTQNILKFLRNNRFLKLMDFIDKSLNHKISKWILSTQKDKNLSYKIPNFKELISQKIANYQGDIVIEGHYHQGVRFEINSKDYINLPCFASERSYFIVEYANEIKFQLIRSPNV